MCALSECDTLPHNLSVNISTKLRSMNLISTCYFFRHPRQTRLRSSLVILSSSIINADSKSFGHLLAKITAREAPIAGASFCLYHKTFQSKLLHPQSQTYYFLFCELGSSYNLRGYFIIFFVWNFSVQIFYIKAIYTLISVKFCFSKITLDS